MKMINIPEVWHKRIAIASDIPDGQPHKKIQIKTENLGFQADRAEFLWLGIEEAAEIVEMHGAGEETVEIVQELAYQAWETWQAALCKYEKSENKLIKIISKNSWGLNDIDALKLVEKGVSPW
jgi:hypothetical protein